MNEYVRAYAKIESRARRKGSFVLTYGPWVLLFSAASIFGRVWTQTQAVRLVEELAGLKQEERELVLAREEEQRVLVGLTTRERVAQEARERLGMDYPSEGEVVFLPVPASPEAVDGPAAPPPARPESGLAAYLKDQLRGVVNQEAYAVGTM